jgi:uncharacterized protein (TIGR04255 family)
MSKEVSFKKPPVAETVLGVQFAKLHGFSNAHLGAFWASLSADWTNVKDVPALEEQFELFGESAVWANQMRLKFTQSSASRLQISKNTGDRMIQIQNGRLDYNWLAKDGGDYPRYNSVRPDFDETLQGFHEFLAERGLGPIQPNQWEITYVNHILKGTVWNEPGDWKDVMVGLPGPSLESEDLKMGGLGGQWHFEIIPRRGRLHVQLQHGRIGSENGDEAMVLKLTARGPVGDGDVANLDQGLNLGHDIIVTSFRDMTSSYAHEYWEKETP